jgi:hypothetical protein
VIASSAGIERHAPHTTIVAVMPYVGDVVLGEEPQKPVGVVSVRGVEPERGTASSPSLNSTSR